MRPQSKQDFWWTLPQPVYVFTCALITASAVSNEWIKPSTLVTIFIWLPIPLILIGERLMPLLPFRHSPAARSGRRALRSLRSF